MIKKLIVILFIFSAIKLYCQPSKIYNGFIFKNSYEINKIPKNYLDKLLKIIYADTYKQTIFKIHYFKDRNYIFVCLTASGQFDFNPSTILLKIENDSIIPKIYTNYDYEEKSTEIDFYKDFVIIYSKNEISIYNSRKKDNFSIPQKQFMEIFNLNDYSKSDQEIIDQVNYYKIFYEYDIKTKKLRKKKQLSVDSPIQTETFDLIEIMDRHE